MITIITIIINNHNIIIIITQVSPGQEHHPGQTRCRLGRGRQQGYSVNIINIILSSQVGPIPSSSFTRDVPSPHKVILSPIQRQRQRQARDKGARHAKGRSKPKTKVRAFTLSSTSDSGHYKLEELQD